MSATGTWNVARYLCYESQRFRPVIDLVSRIPAAVRGEVRHILDLGCGTGNAVPLLHDLFPSARFTCVDSSKEMLAAAREALVSCGADVTFVEQSVQSFHATEQADLVFSNAVLHWVDDHHTVLARIAAHVAPGGVLAVQMPDTRAQASHRHMIPLAKCFGGEQAEFFVPQIKLDPRDYFGILRETGFEPDVDMWATEYQQVLDGEDPVPTFTSSTGLRPILTALGGRESERGAAFYDAYCQTMRAEYPSMPDGRTVMPFRRLFFVARKLS